METLWTIVGLVVIAFLAKSFASNWMRRFRAARDKAYNKTIQQNVARDIANGMKPVGESWGGSSHGAAYFLSTQQLLDKNLAIEQGDVRDVGRIYLGGHATGRPNMPSQVAEICAPKEGHIITVAPTRSGKGTCHVVPNLLTYVGSAIVNDIKGENADITTRFRKSTGQKVFRFAPFEKDSANWNPLDFISDGGNKGSDASIMADMLIMDYGGEEAFWTVEAKNLLSGVIMYVMTNGKPEERTMENIRAHLMLPPVNFDKMLDNMSKSDSKFVRHAAIGFRKAPDKVQDSVISTINSNMKIWECDEIEAVTGTSDFKFEDLKNERITIYFCIPPELIDVCAPLMRLFFGQAIKAMTRNDAQAEWPVTFFLDEFVQLGRMEPIQNGLSYLAGYGVRLWLFAQDLGQIEGIYGRDKSRSILANCGCRVFLGTNDPETSKYVSDMCGTMTVPTQSSSKNQPNRIAANAGSESESISLTGRPLMLPEEVEQLAAEGQQLVFIQGENPTLGDLIKYYEYPDIYPPEDYDKWKGAPENYL